MEESFQCLLRTDTKSKISESQIRTIKLLSILNNDSKSHQVIPKFISSREINIQDQEIHQINSKRQSNISNYLQQTSAQKKKLKVQYVQKKSFIEQIDHYYDYIPGSRFSIVKEISPAMPKNANDESPENYFRNLQKYHGKIIPRAMQSKFSKTSNPSNLVSRNNLSQNPTIDVLQLGLYQSQDQLKQLIIPTDIPSRFVLGNSKTFNQTLMQQTGINFQGRSTSFLTQNASSLKVKKANQQLVHIKVFLTLKAQIKSSFKRYK